MAAPPPPAAAPLVIAHRGASADVPEHTLAAYALAIAQGADFIEPDLVMTRDGVLVARHENEISGTTDVADRPEFAHRRRTQTIDGTDVTGWFTEDFTLAELRRLRATERIPKLRPQNRQKEGDEGIPTFDQIVKLAKAAPRPVGVYPETKHPGHFARIGLPMEAALLRVLADNGWADATNRVFIQSFEVNNLKALRQKTRLPLVQLIAADGGPADVPGQSYQDMLTPQGLAAIATYADALGVEKSLVRPRRKDGSLDQPTGLVDAAHRLGLKVHAWTFRPENVFLPVEFRRGNRPEERGDAEGEIRAFLAAGIDGLFSDSVPPARTAADRMGPRLQASTPQPPAD
ncbi:glycerophosphodiester phosphodiesterase [Thermaurantiacus sp.]